MAASLLFAPLGLGDNPVLAQNKKFKIVPASDRELRTYFGISTNVFCKAREEGIDFKKAARISIVPIFGAINQVHGSKVPGTKKKLTREELGKFVENWVFITASNACPKYFPKEVLESVDKFKKENIK